MGEDGFSEQAGGGEGSRAMRLGEHADVVRIQVQ